MKLNKQIILPLLSAILIFVKESTGYELPDGTADLAAELIGLAIASSGIFIHPRKSKVYDEENMV